MHGISATCKTTIVRNVLAALEVPHAIVRSPECITGRHLLTKILWATLEALGKRDEWEKYGKGRCEHVSSLAVLLGECLASLSDSSSSSSSNDKGKFVLVLDGIDKQREAPHTLLSALARLGEVVCFFFYSSSVCWWGVLANEVIVYSADSVPVCRPHPQL